MRRPARETLGPSELALALLLLLSAATLVPFGRVADVAVAVLIAALVSWPLLRVGTLALQWWRIGDRRYAVVAVALLVVSVGGALVGAVFAR